MYIVYLGAFLVSTRWIDKIKRWQRLHWQSCYLILCLNKSFWSKQWRMPTLVNIAIKQKETAAKGEKKKDCFSVLFPRAKQQTYSVDVGNEDSLLDFTSCDWISETLSVVNGRTSSTTIAHLWRMGGGLSVILLTVNPVYSLDFLHFLHVFMPGKCWSPSLFSPAACCPSISTSTSLLASVVLFSSFLIPTIFFLYPTVSSFQFPSFLLHHFLLYLSSFCWKKPFCCCGVHQPEWLPVLLIPALNIATYTPTPRPSKTNHHISSLPCFPED